MGLLASSGQASGSGACWLLVLKEKPRLTMMGACGEEAEGLHGTEASAREG